MRYRRFRRPSKPQIFAILMLASLCLLFLPPGFLWPVKHLTQLAALPQWLAHEGAQNVTDQIHDLSQKAVSGSTHEQVVERNAALERENASLRQQLAELQTKIDTISQIRSTPGFPANGKLIPARVMALDAATGRDSLLVGKAPTGSAKAKKGDWVASRILVEAGAQDGVENQSAVLSQECLIGWVEETGPLASRVVLLSDPAANKVLRVRIKSADFTLKGAGSGQMKLVEMPREFVENGKVAAGDWVMSHPNDPKLPVSIVIGRIKELHRVKEKPVYYEATVEPACAVKSLRQVYIVDLSKSELQQNSTSKNP